MRLIWASMDRLPAFFCSFPPVCEDLGHEAHAGSAVSKVS